MIISASRRCDLPATGMAAFMDDLAAGFRLVRNPFNASQVKRVSLRAEDVDCIVFWTRDPRALLACMGELESRGLAFYVQMTLTGYPKALEPGVLDTDRAIAAFLELGGRIGNERMLWRYDPILVADGLGADFHAANFSRLAACLEGATRRVTLSLLDEYRGTTKRLAQAGYPGVVYGSIHAADGTAQSAAAGGAGGQGLFGPRLPPPPYPSLLAGLAAEAKRRGMEAAACAEPFDLESLGIGRAACIDASLASRIAGRSILAAAERGQRPECGCSASVDIGAYGPCPARCAYCYARR